MLRAALPSTWTIEHRADAAAADYLVVGGAAAGGNVAASGERLRLAVLLEDAGGSLDHEAFARGGIPVQVVQSSTLITVAEHTVMAILVIMKRAFEATTALRAGVMDGGAQPTLTTQTDYAYNWTGLRTWEGLYGKTVGLVGIGEIGSHVARQLQGFGAEVLYTKPQPLSPERERALGVRYTDLDALLRSSDCVSLHTRVTPATEDMMGERELALMRPGSFFVNTARGRLVDEAALCKALESGHLAGAALDVFQMEPLPTDSPLLHTPNTFLTPHIAGIPTSEARVLELREAARRLITDDQHRSRE